MDSKNIFSNLKKDRKITTSENHIFKFKKYRKKKQHQKNIFSNLKRDK